MAQNLPGDRPIPKRITAELDKQQLAELLKPRSDLTYRVIQGVNIDDISIHQSLLTGAMIRDAHFRGTDFSRCDLDGVRTEKVIFEACNFANCDIRCSLFGKADFRSCSFDKAFIDDCYFGNCSLTKCSLAAASLTQTRFHGTALSGCSLEQSTLLHNRLSRCVLTNMKLGDCTILFSIFDDCSLQNVRINADAIGAIFGLTREQLLTVKLMFLGREEDSPDQSELVELLESEYRKRHWDIGLLVLILNLNLSSILAAFDTYLRRSQRRFQRMGFVKGDEIRFLGDILEQLAERHQLPLLTVLDVLRWCTTLRDAIKSEREAGGSSLGHLSALANRANIILNSMLEHVEELGQILDLDSGDRGAHLKVVFQEKPTIQLVHLLSDINSSSSRAIAGQPALIRVESGSYVEVVSTTLFTVLGLQVFLYLINGCLIQLTELKVRAKALAQANRPKGYQFALTPAQPTSPVVLSAVQSIANYTKGLRWLKGNWLGGFAVSNIKSLEILPPDEADQASAASSEKRKSKAADRK